MIFNRKNLLVAGLVQNEDRFGGRAHGVHLTEKYSEVTNGHFAVRVPAPPNGDQSLELPVDKTHRPFRKKRFDAVIPVDVAQDVIREIDRAKTSAFAPCAGITWVGRATDEKKVEFLVLSKDGDIKAVEGKKDESKFPNLAEVIKRMRGKPKAQFALDAKYLKQLAEQFLKSGEKVVCFSVYGPDLAMRLESEAGVEQRILAVIMPIKAALPDWRKAKKVKLAPEGNIPESIGDDGTIAVEEEVPEPVK